MKSTQLSSMNSRCSEITSVKAFRTLDGIFPTGSITLSPLFSSQTLYSYLRSTDWRCIRGSSRENHPHRCPGGTSLKIAGIHRLPAGAAAVCFFSATYGMIRSLSVSHLSFLHEGHRKPLVANLQLGNIIATLATHV